jgi:hypothetical protein
MRISLFFIILNCFHFSFADIEHQLIRRVVVFPLASVADKQNEALKAWWSIRETLTSGKLFLVASKDFLERKDVFQARGKMSAADVIILCELLDAQMILTGEMIDKNLTLYAYEADKGQLLWTHSLSMHPSLPISDQIEKASVEITKIFIGDFPYHGFTFKDELSNEVILDQEGKHLVQVQFSENIQIDVGDSVQWVKLKSQNLNPLFQGGGFLEIFAEGKVISVSKGNANVEILRTTNINEIKELSLIRFPIELKRLKELHALKDNIKRRINPDYFATGIGEIKSENQETKPLVTAVTFLINLATILLMAF